MTDQPYCWQKLFEATLALASGDEPLRDRLASAYLALVYLIIDGSDDFYGMTPEEQERFRAIIRPFQECEAPALVVARGLDELQASHMASEIVGLFSDIAQRPDPRR